MKKVKLPVEFESENLVMRRHRMSFAIPMFAALSANRARLSPFLTFATLTKTLADQKKYIQRCLDEWQHCEMFAYSIFTKSQNIYAGNISVHTINWDHHRCELGYWLDRKFEGQGLMSEAVHATTRICYLHNFYRIEIRCSPENTRSSGVAVRCGFIQEGHFRNDRLVNGRRHSTLIYARLRDQSNLKG